MSFLQKILPSKEAEVAELKRAFANTKPTRPQDLPVRDFPAAMLGGYRLIAEIKHKSPSHSKFYQPASPSTLARAYERNGAAALSIVVDAPNFGTSLSDVAPVKAAVSLPILVKDFVIDEVQLLAAWAAGADAVLLIVRMLDGTRLSELLAYAHSLGLHVLVECHDQSDIDLAIAAKAQLIGVNNRNLATLTTDLNHGATMLPGVPAHAIRISESGLYKRADIERMAQHGADAFLVGHALLQSSDPGRKVAELSGRESETRVRVKTCGITNPADAVMAHEAGSNILGLIFVPGDRHVGPQQAQAIRQAVPKARLCGVFVNEDLEKVTAITLNCDLDLIQLHGNESPDYCQSLANSTGLPLIKALTPNQATAEFVDAYASVAYFLVDLPKGVDKEGLTPENCRDDVSILKNLGHEVFLAGSLTPVSVHDACKTVKPFGVDVASGIESSPGIKDAGKTQTFVVEATRGGNPMSPSSFFSSSGTGRFGPYGGQFVPETLMPCLQELEQTWNDARVDAEFNTELANLLADYSGRPTPLYRARRMEESCGGKAKIYLKREDLNHTGAHKINNCLGQILLARRMGKSRIVAETGAGQHGVATATVCALVGLDCTVYMGEVDMERQAPNVARMELMGAKVVCVTSGARTLKDASSEAIRDWVTNVATTHYILGSVVGPHPYPAMVRDFQAVIGTEARQQILVKENRLPDAVIACVGGGSNAIGIFSGFVEDDVALFGVEAGGSSAGNSAALSLGEPGVLHGSFSYLLQNEDGQVIPAHSIAAGLDYPGVGPEHSHLKDTGRVSYSSVTDSEALAAFNDLSLCEGIIPALESSHALAFCRQLTSDESAMEKLSRASNSGKPIIIINLSGRGDKDMNNRGDES